MAEAHNLKLVISADTSDAEKKLKDVGNTKVPPVKVDVVADEVKVDAPKVAPVKVPVEQPKPVKVPVEQPAAVKIKTVFDSTGLGKVSNALHGIRELANKIMSALGLFGFVAGLVMSAVAAFNALKNKIDETRNAAKRLQDEFEKSRIDERIKRETAACEALNKALAEANRLEKERNDIVAGRKAAERAIEDSNEELAKQKEIAALDPNDESYKSRKADIERKYADRASERRAERAGIDSRDLAKTLYAESNAKEREADSLQKEADRRNHTFELARERSWATGMKARSGKEEDVKAHEEAEKVANDAYDAWKKVDDEIKKIRGEAQSLRNRAGELAGGNLAANQARDAEKIATENAERERRADEKREADRKAKESSDKAKTEKQTTEDARLNRQKQEDLAALNPADKDYAAKVKEIERLYEMRAAENKVKRAETPEARAAAQEDLDALKIQHDRARREESANKIPDLESFAQRADAIDGVSQNRLTAMGLGSGVTAKGTVQSDVRRLVDLLRQNVEATKNIKLGDLPDATYGE